MMQSRDASEFLAGQVREAFQRGAVLNLIGNGSKAFYGRSAKGEPLSLTQHCGIIEYESTELVLTARSGTALADIESVLADANQILPFEPPWFGPVASLGGTVACGLSGPRRPYAGSVRDAVLGVKFINGKGEILRFGGQVLKNVAGFDVSRLMVGALGTLGVLLEISLRVMARPEAEQTVVFETSTEEALISMNRWAGQNWPLSAASHDDGKLYLRLSGSESAIKACWKRLGGEILPEGDSFWVELREHHSGFFQTSQPLWRLSLPSATPQPDVPGDCLIDWGGALRWVKTDAPADKVFKAAQAVGGHATLFRHGDRCGSVFQPLPERLQILQQDVKKAFDPKGILNIGRFYEAW